MKNYFKILSVVLSMVFIFSSASLISASTEGEYVKPDKFIYGDVNQDGEVTVKDVTLIQKYLSKIEGLSLLQLQAAKISQGKITIRNATDIQKYLAKIALNNSIVGKCETIIEPAKINIDVDPDTAATGDEIMFKQSSLVFWDTRCESWEYFTNNRCSFFKENHYMLNDLDTTELANKYNDEYFDNNALLVISFGANSSSYKYRIDSINKSDGILNINYTFLFPEDGAINADVVDTRLYIEVEKEDVLDITGIATYKSVELY